MIASPLRMFGRPLAPVLAAAVALGLAAASAVPAGAAHWDTYNNANSLVTVRASASAVWCGSTLGVHRYDPAANTFTRFAKSNDGLVSNSVQAIAVDASGAVWFGTSDHGASVLVGGSWRTLDTFDGLPSDVVTAIEPSAYGTWIGTPEGLALFDDAYELVTLWPDGLNPSPFRSDAIRALTQNGDSMWVATTDGVYVTRTSLGLEWVDRSAGLAIQNVRSLATFGGEVWCVSGTRVQRSGLPGGWNVEETGLTGGGVSLAAHAGDLLCGTTTGVFRWDGSAWQPLAGPGNADVSVDPNGGFWGGNVEGLWQWTGAGWNRRLSPGPAGNYIQAMALEGSTLYATTRFTGVSRFDGTTWRNFTPEFGSDPDTTLLSPDFLFGLLVDRDGTKWIGDWGHGLARLNDSTEPPSVTHYYDVAHGGFLDLNTFVWSSAQDADGDRWFGLDTDNLGVKTPHGINRISANETQTNYNPQTADMSGPQVRAIAFAPTSSFEMWVGYAGLGIDIFTDKTLLSKAGRITSPTILSDDLWAIEFHGDDVWVGTSSGLTRLDRVTRQARESAGTQPPSSRGAVNPMAVDVDGGVWWGTLTGLYHRRPDGTAELFSETNSPLLSNDIHSVVVDKATGDVWIGTILGINRYNPGGTTGPTPAPSANRFNVSPNPAFASSAGVVLKSADLTGSFKGRVFDLRGRVVRHLLGNATTGSLWDAKDEHGVPVRPGLYILEVTQGSTVRTGRVFLIR